MGSLWRYTLIPFFVLVQIGLSVPTIAQQQPAATSKSTANQPTTKEQIAQSDSAEQKNPWSDPGYDIPTGPDPLSVREIGRATLLTNELNGLRWGAVFLRSVEFLQAFSPASGSLGSFQDDVNTSLFEATIGYDKQLRRSRLTLQYHPRVGVTNGRTFTNLANREVQFQTDYSYRANARWSMSISEALAYRGADSLYTGDYLSVDTLRGAAIQNNFLEGPFEALSSSTSLTFLHAFSPRTHLSFGPQFSYGYSSGGYQGNASISSPTYAGTAYLEHVLSPTRSMGVSYSFQRILISRTFANTTYQTAMVSYSQQLRPSLRVSFALGSSAVELLGQRDWNASGSFNLSKTFRRSYLSMAYTRGHRFSGYINNGETQRADFGYGFNLTRRMDTQLGAGYEWTTSTLVFRGARPVRVSGTYASAQLNYQLLRNISWFSSFVRRKQASYDFQVFPGNRDFVATGFIWTPGIKPSY